MKKSAKTAIKNLLYDFPFLLRKHLILLESTPDFSDSTKYVFDELIRRNVNESYKIYWVTQVKEKVPKQLAAKNIRVCKRNSLKFKLLHFSAKYIIDSNSFISKIRKRQLRIHLGHGCPIKLTYEYSSRVGELDYFTVISPFFKSFFCDLFKIDESKIKTLGLPRNDGFFNDKHLQMFPEIRRKKTIVWMPTYRNHKNRTTGSIQVGTQFPFGVPCVNSISDLEILNSVLQENNILLVLKLHPAEDLSKITSITFSNIKLFDNLTLKSNDMQLYDILKDFDALITDYSSVYYDYLLARKPIGLAIPDIAIFSKTCTLISEKYTDFIKGDYIYNLNDLLKFIKIVASGKDPAKKDIEWALSRYHKYQDGNSSKRVVDLLIKEMEKDK